MENCTRVPLLSTLAVPLYVPRTVNESDLIPMPVIAHAPYMIILVEDSLILPQP